ncbi:hypothetical protein TrVE_jg9559 [Triparma verrucosa]|uniref:Uncharacterized protein n=1 Tax=Triparma verrucosa TaxID=1606542 RepID=A0A9W7EZT1_9STRA|nr:hypothetical protein TrVE_jg9559 [Triparma verrucosa]
MRKVIYIGLISLVFVEFFCVIPILLEENNAAGTTAWVVLSNTSIFPAFVFGVHVSLWTCESPLVLLDTLAALYAANASIWYHFCDTDTLPYCLSITKYSWENVTEVGNVTHSNVVNYEWVGKDEKVYEFTQYADFTGAFFMMSVAFLSVADIRPLPFRAVVYALALYFTWVAMAQETRFQKDGLLGVLKVITGSAILALLRIIYTVRHIYKKDAEDKDATASVFSAMKTTLWIFPKRFSLLAGIFIPSGLSCKIFLEDETTGNYADYAVPHGWWHVLMFGGSLWVLCLAVTFNARARNYKLQNSELPERSSSNPMTMVEMSGSKV